jgi:hypothetical protein
MCNQRCCCDGCRYVIIQPCTGDFRSASNRINNHGSSSSNSCSSRSFDDCSSSSIIIIICVVLGISAGCEHKSDVAVSM